jgi:tetratricopeptide (TPR) repeat protein
MVFDTYVEAEETMIGLKMNDAAARSDKGKVNAAADADLDIRLVRFESLMQRRPFLLNDVLLRQNPHNVIEWEKRVALWGDNKKELVQTYTDAIAAIHPKKAVGKFHELWTNYAKFYEAGGSLHNARAIMEKAVKVPFKSVAELAEMWVEWAEMELRNENFDKAVEIMAKATQAPKRSNVDYFDESLTPQQRVHKSWKLWSFYVDLVESVSTLEETKKVYERIFELRIATPQTVVNYANLLEENQYFEDCFKVYERGLDLFSYPVAFEIWNLYLTKAVDRKIGMERLRDLFEQAVEGCPPKFAKVLYLMYGALEEDRGLARHAMRIYERATRAVADEDRMDMFNFYITKSASNFGLTSTRPIYERAISALPDAEAKEMCLKFAEMERRLGEIDRARAIYGHASQFCDPRTSPEFWKKWESFEVQHGNEDTYKEMLRIKRSVQAQYKYAPPLQLPSHWLDIYTNTLQYRCQLHRLAGRRARQRTHHRRRRRRRRRSRRRRHGCAGAPGPRPGWLRGRLDRPQGQHCAVRRESRKPRRHRSRRRSVRNYFAACLNVWDRNGDLRGVRAMGSYKCIFIGVFGRPLLARRASCFFFFPPGGDQGTLSLGCVCALALHLMRVHTVVLLFCFSFVVRVRDIKMDPRSRDRPRMHFFCLGGKWVGVGSDLLFHFSCLQLDHYLLIYKYIGGIWDTCTSAGILESRFNESRDDDISVNIGADLSSRGWSLNNTASLNLLTHVNLQKNTQCLATCHYV